MEFEKLAEYFEKLESTASRITITEILAELFISVKDDEIGKICYLLQGRVVPLYEAVEFGIADKFMMRAIARSCDTDQKTVSDAFQKYGDLGVVAQILKSTLPKTKNVGMSDSVSDIFDRLYKIATTNGLGSQESKIEALSALLTEAGPLSAKYLVRIPLGKLRLGFSDMTILDALSWMLAGDKSMRPRLEDAFNVRPDIGYIAEMVKGKGIDGVKHVKIKVGAPILASLCQRLPTADEMIKKMGVVDVEPKYDGVRCQIHFEKANVPATPRLRGAGERQASNVKTFSRNLENTTEMFPEALEIGEQLNAQSVILDSEVVGVDPKTGKIVSFQETTTRKRKHDVTLFSEELPVRFYVFDILFKDGEELLGIPLSERRAILEKTIRNGKYLAISPHIVTDCADDIRKYHDEQIKLGLEGAVVKKWNSPYEPGRRGFSWVKFKEEEGKTGKLTDTVDCVVMGYYRGEGKRTTFGIGALLVGVRKDESFVTMTKIGTGVTDELWKDLFTALGKLKTEKRPREYPEVNKTLVPDVWVTPEMVVEVAGDDLTISPIHGAGIAMRFPRLVKIRTDKSYRQTTTVRELRKMYDNQEHVKG